MTDLGDLIGRVQLGDQPVSVPFPQYAELAAELNTARDEIERADGRGAQAGRCRDAGGNAVNNERSHHVEVVGSVEPDDADIGLTCRVCDWYVWIPVDEASGPTLSDLIDAADEHFDNAGGHP